MIDQQSVERAAERFQLPEGSFERLELRRDRRRRNQRIRAGVLGIAIAVVVGWWGVHAITSTEPTPADRSKPLGIFAPVAGRIVFMNEGSDRGYRQGIWAVDPNGPPDTTEGPSVADDVASTLMPLPLKEVPGFENVEVFGWSGDGTELLFARIEPYSSENPFPQGYLYVLHADGSETRLNSDPMSFAEFPAAISPDGKHVAYAADGVNVVDAQGGRSIRIAEEGEAPTFSTDGTQIAYLAGDGVWVTDADGSDAHEILTYDQNGRFGPGVTGMQWSPAGDRIALGLGGAKTSDALAIYTFAPDGSNFTRVITGGEAPYWSPDGTQIAFTVPCGPNPTTSCPEGSILRSQYDEDPELFGGGSPGLAVADADGSNVREYGFATSGPWHPGESTADEPAPTPDEGLLRANGEVLDFTGGPNAPGDLVAVNPETGEERVLVEDADTVVSAEWSTDGRWVAYETSTPEGGRGLWVVGVSQESRQVATDDSMWTWSSTGDELAVIRRSATFSPYYSGAVMSRIDPVTGLTTDAGSIPERFGKDAGVPAWSPDGTRFVFGVRGGSIYSVDVRSGARSLLVHLPGEDLDSVDQIVWSPDGAHIAIMNDGNPGGVYVMDADGSNVRLLLDDWSDTRFAWSPDGSRLAYQDGSGTIWVAAMDESAPTEIGTPLRTSAEALLSQSDIVWSPDGSRVGFRNIGFLGDGDVSVDVSAIDVDGRGEAERIDELTYRSWDGGSYSCECA